MSYKGQIFPLSDPRSPTYRDPVGEHHGKLTVTKVLGRNSKHQTIVEAICDCGNVSSYRIGNLRNHTKSCGLGHCTKRGGNRLTHGLSKDPEYHAISNAASRCYSPRNKQSKDYLGRGIIVDQRYYEGPYPGGIRHPENLIADIGPRPSKDYTLERIDNDGNYTPGNIKWETRFNQNLNKRHPLLANATRKQLEELIIRAQQQLNEVA